MNRDIWVGQKFCLVFFVRCYGETRMNFLPAQYLGTLFFESLCLIIGGGDQR